MSSNLFSIVFMVLFFNLSKCQDFCSLIQPKGRFNGLGTYRRWNLQTLEETDDDFYMYSRGGDQEWKFKPTESKSGSTSDLDIKMIGKQRDRDKNILYRYGLFVKFGDNRKTTFFVANCLIVRNDYGTNTYCTMISKTTNQKIKQDRDRLMSNFPKYPEYLVLKHSPKKTIKTDPESELVVVVNKNNRNQNSSYNTREDKIVSGSLPLFIHQIESSLFNNIYSILDYNFGDDKSGWFLFFNIDGRPKFCATEEGKDLSEGCKSEESLKTLFSDCFLVFPTPTPISMTKEEDNHLLIIILSVGIAIGIVIILCIIGYYIYWKKSIKGTTSQSMGSWTSLLGKVQPSSTESSTSSTDRSLEVNRKKNPPKTGPSSQKTGLKPNSPKK